MKNLFHSFTYLLLLGVLFTSCDNTTTKKETATSVPDVVEEVVTPKYCNLTGSACDVAGEQYQITEACARCWMSNYKARGSFPTTKDGNIEGFKIKSGELADIVNENPGKRTVYSMLGLNQRSATDLNPEMIFVAQDSVNGGLRTLYYNFTTPCPTTCPE